MLFVLSLLFVFAGAQLQTDLVGGVPLALDFDVVSFAAELSSLTPKPDKNGLNMLFVTMLQCIGDHSWADTPKINETWSVVPNHPFFKGVSELSLTRSGPNATNNVPMPPLRGFFLFGPPEREELIRDGDYLKTDIFGLPPRADSSGNGMAGDPRTRPFLVGDARGNETPFLLTVHIIFVRWFNIVVDTLDGPNRYERAKHIVIGHAHTIIFRDLLPRMVGVPSRPIKPIEQIDKSVSGAFFRPHGRVNGNVIRQLGRFGIKRLADVFFSPEITAETKGDLRDFVYSMQNTPAFDGGIALSNDVNRLLFRFTDHPAFSLGWLNIMRGFDLELSDFNSARIAVGLDAYTSFDDFVDDPEVLALLKRYFPNGPNTCPIWICAHAENFVDGYRPTATIWIQNQMYAWMDKEVMDVDTPSIEHIICETTGACITNPLIVPKQYLSLSFLLILGVLSFPILFTIFP